MLKFKRSGAFRPGGAGAGLRAQPYRVCDHSFRVFIFGKKTYPARYFMEDGILYIMYQFPDGSISYQMPLGAGDRLAYAVERLEKDAEGAGSHWSLSRSTGR